MKGNRTMNGEKTPGREPITMPWLWVALVGTILIGVPWYLPPGTLGASVFHVPAWFWISIVAAAALSAVCCYACLSLWDLEDHEDWSDLERAHDDEGSLR